MIAADMPKRLPHLQRETTRHGATVWFVRVDRGQRHRVRGEFGSAEFVGNYRAALAVALGQAATAGASPGAPDRRTLAWLFDQWRQSSDWGSKAHATRRQRENVLSRIIAENPRARFSAITPAHIAAGRERRQATPAAANNFIKTMRALFGWAQSAGHVAANPAAGVAFIPSKTTGFRAWEMADLERFRARWPLGTRQRLALEIIANTGLRRGDVVRLGRQHVRGGVATIRAEKTGVELFLPILPALAEAIDACPSGDLTFFVGAGGRPMTKEAFGNFFRAACKAARVDGAAHGVRKLAATIAADNGASEHELQALFGWQTNDQSAVYTRTANRRRLATQAAAKMATQAQTGNT